MTTVIHQPTNAKELPPTTDVVGAEFIVMHGGVTKVVVPGAVATFVLDAVAPDLADTIEDVDALRAQAVSAAATATTKAGLATAAATTAETKAGVASAAATTATAKADLAVTAADTATSSAALATTKASAAMAAASDAHADAIDVAARQAAVAAVMTGLPAAIHTEVLTTLTSADAAVKAAIGAALPLATVTDFNGTAMAVLDSYEGVFIRTTAATAVTVTLPNSKPTGFAFGVMQGASGQVTFVAGGGPPMRQVDGCTKTRKIYSEVTAKVIANIGGTAAEWLVSGDMV